MGKLLPFLAVAALLGSAASARGQGFAILGQVGTTGVGGGAVIGLTDRVHLRGTFGVAPFDVNIAISDIDFTLEPPTAFRAMVDLYPTGSFRLTGGIFVQGDVVVTADFEGTTTVDVGDQTYAVSEVGTLSGILGFDTALYGGIGFGNPIGKSLGISFDLGLAVRSEPAVELSASGPISSDPTFQADLAREEEQAQNDAQLLRFWPVIALSISIGF